MNNRSSFRQSTASGSEFGKPYRHNRHRKLGVETLEPRQVMSASALMLDVNPNSENWTAEWLTAVGDTLYFSGRDETNGWELWKSDGTIEGTAIVRDINPGPNHAGLGVSPAMGRFGFTHINGTLYGAADDGVTGSELWKSDGTAEGTGLVRDIVPGPAGSTPVFVTAVNDTLFFAATDPLHGTALWTSDGTNEGAVMVKDIIPGTDSSFDQTWLGDSRFGPFGRFIAVEDSLYFLVKKGEDSTELWKSDGSADGTFVVKDGFRAAFDGRLVGGRLFFGAGDETNGYELWTSDGTADGTVAIKNSGLQTPRWLTDVDGTLYFIVLGEGSVDLWKTDGTQMGTVLVKSFVGYDVDDLTDFNGTLYFSLSNNGQREMWRSDGTADGTVHVTSKGRTLEGWGDDSFFVVGDTLFFSSRQNGKNWLWQSDGTEAGTEQVPDISGFNVGPVNATVVNDQVFFIANDDDGSCCELWVLDTGLAEPSGDFNADARYDCADVDALVDAIHAAANDPAFDLTGDTIVNRDDLDAWLAEAARANGFGLPYVRGDATLDGEVNASDLNIVGLSWQKPARGWCRGDFDANGVVDAGDLNQLALNWRSRIGAAADPRPDGDVQVEPGPAANSRTPRAPLAAGAPVAAAVVRSDEPLPVSLQMTKSWNHSAPSIVGEHLTATDTAPGETRASLRQRNETRVAREAVRHINDLALVEVVDENVRATTR